MNNLPENEKAQADDFSTVFSDPEEHKNVVPKTKVKRTKIALALCLVVAILLGGTVAVIKLIPETETEIASSSNIEVVSYESDDIKEMTVENKNGKFKFYSEKEETESSEEEETITGVNWYIKGYDAEMIDGDLICDIVEEAVGIEAIREITEKSVSECGFDEPVATAKFTTNDGEKETVIVGANSPDNAGVYVKLESKDNIYLVGDSLDETLNFTDLDLASTEAQGAVTLDEKYSDYCSGGVVASSDYVTVEGVNFSEKMVFRPTRDETFAVFTPYEVLEPTQRSAENVETVFLVFTGGFNVSGAYSYDVESETIKSLGLDSPDFVLSAIFDDYTYSYKFKQQEDGDYAFIGNDSKYVKKVTLSDCSFLSYTTTDFYSSTIFMASIDDVSNLTLETEDKTYSFDIEENPSGDDTEKYLVECDGKSFKSAYFQSFYAYLCMLQAIDFETENVSSKPELTITYTYADEELEPTVITFVKESAVRYQYCIDGVPMGRLGSSDYTKILKNLERLLDGKQVVVN